MFGTGTKNTFREYVQGTWGSFGTPAGDVDYIMTKARLGGSSDDPERLLTKSLAPVREIMDAGDLDFNQLLQRDLDDHRVAVNLIPYLLKPESTGPAFFPPIVAVLLPFQDQRPSLFPDLGLPQTTEDDGANWQQQRAGSAFKVQRLLGEGEQLHGANLGKLWWNPSEASLVVLDGQHRAMALLAIERTLSNSWRESGLKYKSFYEQQVKQALKEHAAHGLDLSKIEVPVTVCWFPEEAGEGARPHEAARKLFVDVNKEARPPSESRIILLSDNELANVLTRSMLSELRSGRNDSFLPLYAVEYDNPEANSSRPARWSVMTNINLLKLAVNRCVFGPPKYLRNVGKSIDRGIEKGADRDAFMREQLDLASLFPESFEDGGLTFSLDQIGDKDFPLGQVGQISSRFAETWGRAILTLLSKTTPYAAHAEGITKLGEHWQTAGTDAALAHDAIFNGMGVYWTLRDSHAHYLESKTRRTAKGLQPDVIRAWEALVEKEEEFERYRSQAYLDSIRPERVRSSKNAFAVFNTHACQLGLVMTLGSLWELRKAMGSALKELPAFAEALVSGWNTYFSLEHGRAKDRKLAFSKAVTNPINQIDKMDANQAVYFRYFWLQALAVPEAWDQVAHCFPNATAFKDMLFQARTMYLDLCVRQQFAALKKNSPEASESKLRPEAERLAQRALQKALRDWFAVSDGEFEMQTSTGSGEPSGVG